VARPPFHTAPLRSLLPLGLLLVTLALLLPARIADPWRDAVLDRVMMALPPAQVPEIAVVDIGALDETGAPWTRAATARLLTRIAEAGPRAIGIDMLFAGDCDGPAAAALVSAMARAPAPVVTGFLLADQPGAALPPAPLAVTPGALLWPAPGAEAPCPAITAAARGLGSIALPGDADGRVRRLPPGVLVAGQPLPTLPLALARQASAGDGAALIGAGALRLPGRLIPLDRGALRLVPSAPDLWPGRSHDAARLLRDPATGALRDKVVLIGSSLPERGGLRPTAASPVTPSVQIAADLTGALMSGRMATRPGWAAGLEAAFLLGAGLLLLGLTLRQPPGRAVLAGLALAAGWAGLALTLWQARLWLIDPLGPGLLLLVVLGCALGLRAARAARAEAALRARLAQTLPAALVSRIAADPGLLRLEGETREVTALFTDIEGFSAAARRLGPRDLVAQLEDYFTLTCRIVLAHGGMIDKLVGDSVHALFNAPLDQPGHEAAAIACARALRDATEAFAATHDLGRTRIGLETGPAVLGDVGAGGRIDYTAHGDAVNLAARLQEANKGLGSRICIGPELARRCPEGLRPLGEVEIRSFGRRALWTCD